MKNSRRQRELEAEQARQENRNPPESAFAKKRRLKMLALLHGEDQNESRV